MIQHALFSVGTGVVPGNHDKVPVAAPVVYRCHAWMALVDHALQLLPGAVVVALGCQAMIVGEFEQVAGRDAEAEIGAAAAPLD